MCTCVHNTLTLQAALGFACYSSLSCFQASSCVNCGDISCFHISLCSFKTYDLSSMDSCTMNIFILKRKKKQQYQIHTATNIKSSCCYSFVSHVLGSYPEGVIVNEWYQTNTYPPFKSAIGNYKGGEGS